MMVRSTSSSLEVGRLVSKLHAVRGSNKWLKRDLLLGSPDQGRRS